jgi:dipeptidyl aminopeptidase/acylaminoacyl peptidase
MLDDYKRRMDSVRDGVEAARWLVAQGYSENGRIAAYGGSYGGYMSVATILEGPEVFGASVDVVGIVNMRTFLEQTKGYRRKLREAEYGPLTDLEFLESISPLHRASEIEIPMLIAHGLNDPRVPVGEAMQLAINLQKRGFDPELYYFPDEGHGFQKLENRLLFNERMLRFLQRTIGAAERDPS